MPERLDDRHQPQAARHRARPAQGDPQEGRPRGRRRHRPHRGRGRERGGADAATSSGCTAQWEDIEAKAPKTATRPTLLYGEPDLAIRVVRDVFNEDFTQLVVAGDEAWDDGRDLRRARRARPAPSGSRKWTGEERRLRRATASTSSSPRRSTARSGCPRGGSLVIDRTEAMTVVDVNTGKFIGTGGNLEETVTKNNLEAAEEIVRQLRLRDVGGIIVIDFIDMVLESNRDLVLRRLIECLGRDRTKHQVAEVTSLGLVQMTRKRVGAGPARGLQRDLRGLRRPRRHRAHRAGREEVTGRAAGNGGGSRRAQGRGGAAARSRRAGAGAGPDRPDGGRDRRPRRTPPRCATPSCGEAADGRRGRRRRRARRGGRARADGDAATVEQPVEAAPSAPAEPSSDARRVDAEPMRPSRRRRRAGAERPTPRPRARARARGRPAPSPSRSPQPRAAAAPGRPAAPAGAAATGACAGRDRRGLTRPVRRRRTLAVGAPRARRRRDSRDRRCRAAAVTRAAVATDASTQRQRVSSTCTRSSAPAAGRRRSPSATSSRSTRSRARPATRSSSPPLLLVDGADRHQRRQGAGQGRPSPPRSSAPTKGPKIAS